MEKTKRTKLTPEQKQRRREFTHQFYRNNKLAFIMTIAAQIVLAVADVLCAELLRLFGDSASSRSWQMLTWALWALAAEELLALVGGLMNRHALNRYTERAVVQYKEHAFSKILGKSISSFGREDSSRYISAMTNDLTQIETNYVRRTPVMVYHTLVFCMSLGLAFAYSWKLALVSLGFCLLPVASSLAFSGKMQSAEMKVSDRNEGFVGTIKDLLAGFSVIKSFKAEREIAREFGEKSETLEGEKKQRNRTQMAVQMVNGMLGGTVQIGTFAVAAVLAINGETTAGVAIAFVQLLNYVLGPIRLLPQFIVERRAAGALVDKLADACAENEQRGGTKVLESIGSGIRFDHVTFGYGDEPVLRDLSVKFEEGKSYAIVGASGSGKSTLLNLILGYRDDYSGEIHIDGEELRDLSTDSLYDMVSTIQQNVFVFNSTIEDNITMFRDFPPERVARAVEQAALDRLIAEKGRDYRCGENGAGLSGGERQRISIARSLVRGAPVLLMDEATSALDAKTAHAVEEQILSIDGLTRLIVTHRLERPLLERYDEIVVLSGGRVVEQGSFDELMEKRGHFAALYSVAQG